MKTLIRVRTRQNILAVLILWFIMFFETLYAVYLERPHEVYYETVTGKYFSLWVIVLILLVIAGILSFFQNKAYATISTVIYIILSLVLSLDLKYVGEYFFAIILLPIFGIAFAIMLNFNGEIEVTDKYVGYRQRLFTLKKNIPIDKVCCVERRIFKEIVIHAPSGKIYGYLVDDVDELYTILNNFINKSDSINFDDEEN